MNEEDLKKYKEKLSKLTDEEKKERDLYLKGLADGTLQGPSVGYSSIDKQWLKYYKDSDINQDIPSMNAYEYLLLNNKTNMDKNAINYFGTKITFKKLDKKVNQIEKSLIANGVKKGDIVTLAMANTPEMIYLFYALVKIGAVCNVIDPRYSADEMNREITNANSKLFIILDQAYPTYKKILDKNNIEKVVCLSATESLPLPVKILAKLKSKKNNFDDKTLNWNKFLKSGKDSKVNQNTSYEKNTPIALVHTGGTTGSPKGVLLTNENFIAMANMHMYGGLNYTKDDKFLNILPPFIAYCLCNGINMPLTLGLEVTLVPKFETKDFPNLLDKYKPNHVLAGPILWEAVINSNIKDLSYLKTPVSGGDVLNAELETRINNFFKEKNCNYKVAQGYGMTEVSSAATFSKESANKTGSVGIPFIKNNIAVFDPETLSEKQTGNDGEIWISTPTAMKEYHNNEKATNDLQVKAIDGKVWTRTSDIGHMDNDGNVYISGRMKRMIVRNGNKIYPSNVENIILKIKDIDNCAIVGIDDPIERKVPVVHIIQNDSSTLSKEEIVEQIKTVISANLPELNIPVKFIFRKEMPLTSINKIDFVSLENETLPDGEIVEFNQAKVR